jgi:hypothetical protein
MPEDEKDDGTEEGTDADTDDDVDGSRERECALLSTDDIERDGSCPCPWPWPFRCLRADETEDEDVMPDCVDVNDKSPGSDVKLLSPAPEADVDAEADGRLPTIIERDLSISDRRASEIGSGGAGSGFCVAAAGGGAAMIAASGVCWSEPGAILGARVTSRERDRSRLRRRVSIESSSEDSSELAGE